MNMIVRYCFVSFSLCLLAWGMTSGVRSVDRLRMLGPGRPLALFGLILMTLIALMPYGVYVGAVIVSRFSLWRVLIFSLLATMISYLGIVEWYRWPNTRSEAVLKLLQIMVVQFILSLPAMRILYLGAVSKPTKT